MADFNIFKTVFIQTNQKPSGWENLTYGTPSVRNQDMVLGSSKISICGVDVDIVNLSKITDADVLVQWLEDNSDYISYDDSYHFIEKVHIIDKKGANDETIEIALRSAAVTRKAFKTAAELTNKLGAKFSNYDYDKNKYIELYFDANDVFQYNTAQFSSTNGRTYHSYPFFRSILSNNYVDTPAELQKCNFEFAEVEIEMETPTGAPPIKVTTVAFKVTFPNGVTTTFYDYSQNPSPALGMGPFFAPIKLLI